MKNKDFLKIINDSNESEQEFWKITYPQKSFDEKVKYWLASIHHGMRTQKDVCGDEYTEFSLKWYNWVKSVEPNFEEILKLVVPKLGFDFNWEIYRERIRK